MKTITAGRFIYLFFDVQRACILYYQYENYPVISVSRTRRDREDRTTREQSSPPCDYYCVHATRSTENTPRPSPPPDHVNRAPAHNIASVTTFHAVSSRRVVTRANLPALVFAGPWTKRLFFSNSTVRLFTTLGRRAHIYIYIYYVFLFSPRARFVRYYFLVPSL